VLLDLRPIPGTARTAVFGRPARPSATALASLPNRQGARSVSRRSDRFDDDQPIAGGDVRAIRGQDFYDARALG
jgi:hypothetical protein